jgi:hypothetical protein
MTTRGRSQCSTCVHMESPIGVSGKDRPFCIAFPDAIPVKVYDNVLDHREPVEGDHGIRWTSDGRDHP